MLLRPIASTFAALVRVALILTSVIGTDHATAQQRGLNASAVPDDIFWSPSFAQPGVYSNPATGGEGATVLALAPGGQLVAAGYFNRAGEVPSRNIARWVNGYWDSVGYGIVASSLVKPTAIAFIGDTMYVGGITSVYTDDVTSTSGTIGVWNGTTWSVLPQSVSGLNGRVYALAVAGGTLYAAGSFSMAGITPANNIARWTGSAWEALGAGVNGSVFALAVMGDTLFVGGSFTTAGGITVNRIAKWSGGQWDSLRSGTSGTVNALAVFGTTLYAGGGFATAGGITVNRIGRWSAGTWSALGSGLTGGYPDDNAVRSIGVDTGGTVFVGGDFTGSGSTQLRYVAKWSDSQWSALGTGLNREPVSVVVAPSGTVYAAGIFTATGQLTLSSVAQFDGTSWRPLGTPSTQGVGGTVNALASAGSDVYAGGAFNNAGSILARTVGRFDGVSWDSLGAGTTFNTVVHALAPLGTSLVVGGTFTNAAGIADADYIALWNGTSWSAIGKGFNDLVDAVLVAGPAEIYAAGRFTLAYNPDGSTTTVNRVARWNGTKWDSLGSGTNVGVTGTGTPEVYALALYGDHLYVGGVFQNAGGSTVPASNIARFSRTSGTWEAVGGGVSSTVRAMRVYDTTLYVGGNFLSAGGNSAISYLAAWNSGGWSPVGNGLNGTVRSVVFSGATLYAGGQFTNAGGQQVNFITRLKEGTWQKLGSGMNDNVHALAVLGNRLYAGGAFTFAGGKQSMRLAAWTIETSPPGPPMLHFPSDGSVDRDTALALEWMSAIGASSYDVQVSSDSQFAQIVASASGLTGTIHAVSGLARGVRYYWRVRAANTEGPGAYSGAFTFTTRPNAPNAPVLVAPSDNAAGLALNLVARWLRTAGATSYRVRLSADSTFAGGRDTVTTDSSYAPWGLIALTKYWWKVTASNSAGPGPESPRWSFTTSTQTGVDTPNDVPAAFALEQNWPNPFNPSTRLSFSVPASGASGLEPVSVRLTVFDVLGREVQVLVDGPRLPGRHHVEWGAGGHASGIYVARLESRRDGSQKVVATVRMLLLR